ESQSARPRPHTAVESAHAGSRRERQREVGKVAKVTMRIFVHAVTFVLRRFIGEVIERLGPQVMLTLGVQPAEVFDGGTLVINSFKFRNTVGRSAVRRS